VKVEYAQYSKEEIEMTLLVFTQDQCRYCHSVTNFLEDNDVPFDHINISQLPIFGEKFDVMGTPTVILMDGEEEIARTSGFSIPELETLIDNL
jgi:protein-disulfide isomerase